MGLDMYFNAKRYVSKYTDSELQTKLKDTNCGLFDWNPVEVQFEVAYWRKHNAIHNWFVENVQDGIDECQESYVSEEQIVKLYDVVCLVLNDHSKAQELLPTTSGFFFGSSGYGEWYYEGLEYTKNVLEPVVQAINNKDSELNGFDFYYTSSW